MNVATSMPCPDCQQEPGAPHHCHLAAWPCAQILRVTVGSTIHGISLAGVDDRDEMAIVIEPAHWALGVTHPGWEGRTIRTKPQGVRSGPGDLDLVVYTLRKWMRLAIEGNPTVLLPFFATPLAITDEGWAARKLAPLVLSRHFLKHAIGYMQSQRKQMWTRRLAPGQDGPAPYTRPHLQEKHGYDTKSAGHFLRIGYQAIELLTTGGLTLPMPADQRQRVINVRKGEWALGEVIEEGDRLLARLRALETGAVAVSDAPDVQAVEDFLAATYRRVWGW